MEWPARLRSKWPPLYALLAVLVVVLVAGGLVYIRALALEESAALADNDTIAQSVASLILAREDGYLKILQAYVGRFRFREAIKVQDRAEAMVHLRQLRETFPELDRPFLATPAGVSWAVYPDAPEVYGRSFAHRDWYRGVSRAWQPYMSEVTEVAAADRALAVALVVPVHDVDGAVIGILGSSQRIEVIRRWLLPIRVPAGDLYVVDRKGQLVFHRQRTLASQARDYAGVPVVQRLLRGEEGLAELGNPVDGEVGLHAYRWLPTLGWGVVVHRSKNLALQRTRTLLLVAAAFTCALAVGIAGTAWLAVRARQRLETQATALGEAERRARLASERAEKSSRAKSEFLANMSHELRTPLNAIIGFSELMHDGKTGPVSADQQEFLGDILASSRHLLQLINDVLDLSKVESGKMEFHPEPVDLAKVVGEIQDVLRGVAAGKRIRLDATVDPGIGPVVLDPAKLKQVLYNFLSNAVKFTPEAGRVSVRAAPEGPDAVRLEVEDTGIGIRAEDLERLFVEFQQLDAGPARTHEGTGLGLALTKRLVEAQGGRVGVRSTLGHGSVFFAILPRVARSSEVAAIPSAPPRAARAGAPTILVIEDEAPDRAWLEQVFTATGYAVEAVASGAEAVARARARGFDAITLDLLLPDVMAHDLVAAIRAEGPNRETPIVVVTVVAEREAAAGFVVHDFLTKPVRSEDLLASLARAKVTPDAPRPVLVVEDDPVSLRLAETALAGRGYRVVGAASGAAGLEAAEAESPAALVLDLMMPGMDGFDFLARYRATPDGRRTPVIVWTAKDLTHEDRVRLDGAVARVVAKRHGGNGPLLEALDTVIRPA